MLMTGDHDDHHIEQADAAAGSSGRIDMKVHIAIPVTIGTLVVLFLTMPPPDFGAELFTLDRLDRDRDAHNPSWHRRLLDNLKWEQRVVVCMKDRAGNVSNRSRADRLNDLDVCDESVFWEMSRDDH